MNILLGLTGSVASVLSDKIYLGLNKIGETKVVATEKGSFFASNRNINYTAIPSEKYFADDKEWNWQKIGDPVQHIELADWADVLVIAPLSANTLAKMVHGICDNLLTCIWMAWDKKKPVVVAPAMNTRMWENRITQDNIRKLLSLNSRLDTFFGCVIDYHIHIIDPVEKKLACGSTGIGAMAPIETIVEAVRKAAKK